MNHQNFLNRHARHRPRFVTSVHYFRSPLSAKRHWNRKLRFLYRSRGITAYAFSFWNESANQPAAAIACLRLSYGKRCREEELRLVARNPLLAEAGGGRRKAAGPPGFFRKWTSPVQHTVPSHILSWKDTRSTREL